MPVGMRTHLAIVLVVVAAASTAAAAPPDATATLSPYFYIEGGDPDVDQLPLESTNVTVKVSGVIADVTVEQVYKNDGTRPITAKYVFPASTRAAVHGLRMHVGDAVITAKIKKRDTAKREFEAARREGKTATLLEQDRPNVFTMNVTNIMPGDRVRVELRYTELLVPEDGVYELRYPTVVGPRYGGDSDASNPRDQFVATPYTPAGAPPSYALTMTGTVAAGMPIAELDSPTHKIATRSRSTAMDFALDASERTGGDRDFVLRYKLAGEKIASGLLLYESDAEKFFLLMVQPPARVAASDIPPREYVFIVDVSGSMYGYPLDTAKELMRDLIGHLRPTDTFNVILFSGDARVMAPRSVPATDENVDKAIALIDGERGGGGTELLPALRTAMALPHEQGVARSFVVVTDGYISAEEEVFRYIQDHRGDANVFSFGIGSSINHFLVEGVAKAGMGEPFVVTDAAEATATAAKLRAYIQSPVLTDVEVEFDGFKAYDVEPGSVPDVLAARPVIIHGKYAGAATGAIRIKGISGRGAYSHSVDVARSTPSPANAALAYLWARTRIANLSDFNNGDASAEEEREITDLGLTYNLLTKYTSFIAVYEVVRNTTGSSTLVKQALPVPAGVSDLAVGMEVGPEPELTVLAILAGLLLAAFAVRRRRRSAL